ncbi:hypothetical protein CAOG_009536 [Capsaspora owczarzaki ATCC 30864]|uniref:Uncharacterized protein n=1 Tax=Capsaspora owczarzaki (strain ATCC 30864) TaxID=595528 RepID=A0A0D2U7V9_CAPO3|nr:hypothetical protein CAOG_009536 [Capsaspora owczarzaki ATCC 30864]
MVTAPRLPQAANGVAAFQLFCSPTSSSQSEAGMVMDAAATLKPGLVELQKQTADFVDRMHKLDFMPDTAVATLEEFQDGSTTDATVELLQVSVKCIAACSAILHPVGVSIESSVIQARSENAKLVEQHQTAVAQTQSEAANAFDWQSAAKLAQSSVAELTTRLQNKEQELSESMHRVMSMDEQLAESQVVLNAERQETVCFGFGFCFCLFLVCCCGCCCAAICERNLRTDSVWDRKNSDWSSSSSKCNAQPCTPENWKLPSCRTTCASLECTALLPNRWQQLRVHSRATSLRP